MFKRKLALGNLVLELDRDRIRVLDENGRQIARERTEGAILADLVRARGRHAVVASHGSRLYHVAAPEGEIARTRFPQLPTGIWIRKERILVTGRDRLEILSARPFRRVLGLRTTGRIDVARTLVSWPVALIQTPRTVVVLNLGAGRGRTVRCSGAILATAVHKGYVLLVERDAVHLLDGSDLDMLDRLRVSQRLRGETLVTARGLGAVLTRDTVVIADLNEGRLRQVGLSGAATGVRLVGENVQVATGDGPVRLDRSGRRI